MKQFFSRLFDFHISHTTLSITRFAFFIVCFCEFAQIYIWRELSFTEKNIHTILGFTISTPDLLLPIAMIIQLFVAFGLFTRFSIILNFIFAHIIISETWYHYHFDYAVVNYAFIFLFMPKPQVLALDCWIKRGFKKSTEIITTTPVPNWFVLLMFFGVELVYFDSLFFKYINTVWLDGLSFWLPAAIPQMSTGLLPDWPIIENEFTMKGLSHLAFTLENIFPLILLRKLRFPIFLIGFGLHLGIVLFFPIPWFGLGMCAIYLLFVRWEKILPNIAISKNNETPVNSATKIKSIIGYAIVIIMCSSQLILIFGKYFPQDSLLLDIAKFNRPYLARAMGIYRHPVYIDSHYLRTAPIIRWKTVIDGQEVLIPSYDDKGYPNYPEISGRVWVLLNFHLRKQRQPLSRLHHSWQYFLLSWFIREGIEPRDVKLYYKDARIHELRLNFNIDNEIEERPWKDAGTISFEKIGDTYKAHGSYTDEFIAFHQEVHTRKKR